MAGAAALALGFYMAIGARQPIVAALAGAVGLALMRWARAERPYSAALIAVDAAAFAIFAFQRNDSIGFWQLPGPWADVWRFNPAGATIALIVYAGGSIMALIAGFRGLRLIEALSLIAVPFLFNLLMAIGADWHMAELGAMVDWACWPAISRPGCDRPRAYSLVRRRGDADDDQPRQRQSAPEFGAHARAFRSRAAVLAAATPLIANAAQIVAQPLLAIFFSSVCAALAQARPVGDRLCRDRPRRSTGSAAGRRASTSAWEHWRAGFVKGAIYGGVFMALHPRRRLSS